MGWGKLAPLLCELNLLGRSYGAGWVNKESLAYGLLCKEAAGATAHLHKFCTHLNNRVRQDNL